MVRQQLNRDMLVTDRFDRELTRPRQRDRSQLSILLSDSGEPGPGSRSESRRVAGFLPAMVPAPAATEGARSPVEAARAVIPASVEPLLEMGFSRRHINMALRANNGNDRMNSIVTWLLEHPDEEVSYCVVVVLLLLFILALGTISRLSVVRVSILALDVTIPPMFSRCLELLNYLNNYCFD